MQSRPSALKNFTTLNPPGRYSTYRGAYDYMKQKGGGGERELVTDVDSFLEGGKETTIEAESPIRVVSS